MPQDQDDIKGADAMKQASTPGPLSGDDVKLLVKLLDTLKPFAEVAEKLKHCHVVEICEPTPDNPSRNIIPMPREWFERAGDDLEYIAIQLHASGVLSEGQASKITGLDRVSVRREVDRIAPTAPVEASGSERDFETAEAMAEAWSDRVEIQHMVDVTSAVFAKWASPELLSRFRQQMMAVIQQAYIEGVGARVEALRPQPSGETRGAIYDLVDEARYDSKQARGLSDITDAILALLSARPLASGGQHSSGEVACVIAFREGKREPDLVSWNALPVGEHRLYTDPVAETAGEAVAKQWRAVDEQGPRTSWRELDWRSEREAKEWEASHSVEYRSLYAAPVPAQGDGKLREAGWSVAVHNDYRLNGEAHTFWLWTHPDGRWIKGEGRTDTEALAQCAEALAALKSTAAQEGGANDQNMQG